VAARALRRDVDKVTATLVTKVKEAKEAQQHRRSETAAAADAAAPAGESRAASPPARRASRAAAARRGRRGRRCDGRALRSGSEPNRCAPNCGRALTRPGAFERAPPSAEAPRARAASKRLYRGDCDTSRCARAAAATEAACAVRSGVACADAFCAVQPSRCRGACAAAPRCAASSSTRQWRRTPTRQRRPSRCAF
jgi:hypothetical protein